MARIQVSADEIVEVRGIVDLRGKIADLPDSLFTGEMTLGSATDWAWLITRKNRLDGLADEQDFDLFVAGLTTAEMSHFKRSVFFRMGGLIAGSYRELVSQDAGGIQQEYTRNSSSRGGGSTERTRNATHKEHVRFLFQQAESELDRLRDVAPVGAYTQGLRIFDITGC